MGDAIYETHIREYLISQKIANVNDLQKKATSYVSAKGQAFYLQKMIEQNFLTEPELAVVQRGRNHKGTRHPKNTDIITYKYATGLEALIGHLYFQKNQNRIDEIMQFIIGE